MSQQAVWILDDDSSIRWVLERALSRSGHETQSFSGAAELYAALEQAAALPGVLLTDIRMPGDDGLQVLATIQKRYPTLPVIVMTAHSDLDSAVNAFQGGAFEYLAKPFDLDEVVHTVTRALEHQSQQPNDEQTATPVADDEAMSGLIGNAPAMQDVFRAIGRLSHSSVTVLLTGESGTGKELVARALHQHSPRRQRPFIALNMAAIPSELVESELFGHEKGAFTGATQRRRGRFEQAHGGTLFLDEIGDMPLNVQTRLLRVLAEGQFYPVGSYEPVKVDVRIIAATHQQLEQRVKDGLFREDLFHRLNVIRLQLPTLEQRREDIPQLARHFLELSARDLGGDPKRLTAAAVQVLQRSAWPGNVRQLENTCRWLTVMAPGAVIDVQDLPEHVTNESFGEHADDWMTAIAQEIERRLVAGETDIVNTIVTQVEAQALKQALEATAGHRQQAAELLGWGRNTLTRKVQQLMPEAD
ncbi:MAG TPA: nitrogen regulation protein NR(I) [Pseudidiomarina sp.]|nr:nitrogen regulation protein NR(I) [Pseudidiomarina sp.]